MSNQPPVFPLTMLTDGVTRRSFCQAAAAGACAMALPGCFGQGDPRRVGTGALDDVDAGDAPNPDPGVDGGTQHHVDMAHGQQQGSPDMAHGQQQPQPDMSQPQVQNTCQGNVYNTNKAPGSYAMNTATYFANQDAFVCRDANGIYAMSSLCTHAGCTVSFRSNSMSFHCPCHSANFNFDGGQPTSPAFSPLDHYSVCLENGNVAFDANTVVNANTRLAV